MPPPFRPLTGAAPPPTSRPYSRPPTQPSVYPRPPAPSSASSLLAGGLAAASSQAPTTTTTPAATPRTLLAVCRALRTAVERSEAAGYHRLPYTPAELWTLRQAVEPDAIVAASSPPGRPAPRT
ncbi:hypothetical protein HK405_013721, partial [Cladochytrium tenue]